MVAPDKLDGFNEPELKYVVTHHQVQVVVVVQGTCSYLVCYTRTALHCII
jgi:hypothetical protein